LSFLIIVWHYYLNKGHTFKEHINFCHTIIISLFFALKEHMDYDKKHKVVELNFEFDEANLSIEDKIILEHLSLVTHLAEA